MTEEQRYRVVRTLGRGRAELRCYEPCVMADVVVRGDLRIASYSGFRPLVTYISRHNIAMTAPVVQESESEHEWRVSFVMPGGTELDMLPRPDDREVTLRAIPEHYAAAIRFSGLAGARDFARQAEQLRAALAAEGLEAIGEPRLARFNPPWTPGFMRRNEVVIDVRAPAA